MKSSTFHSRRRDPGFTLVEFLGVIAIVAILAGYSLVSAQRILIDGRRTAEEATLRSLAGGLTNVVRQSFTVPSSSTWSTAVAAQLNRSLSEVLTNTVGNRRAVVVDPSFQLGTPTAPFSSLPFTQTIAGARQPVNLNFVILSSLDEALPSLTSYGASAAQFAELWNSADTALPASGWPTSWKGTAADLKRERVTLTGLFYRLVLNNLDATNSASWGMGGTTTNAISPNSRKELWVVDGTAVDLHNAGGGLFARDIIHADASYIYMVGRWVQAVVPVTVALNDPSVGLVNTVDSFLDTVTYTLPPASASAEASGSGGGSVDVETVAAGTCSGCKSSVTVLFNGCTNSVYVTSCRDLSNVVLEMCDGTRYKHDNLSLGTTGWFASPDGQNIVRVWVKSGCYKSDDGPGYGWRVDGPCVSGSCGGTSSQSRSPAAFVEAAFSVLRAFTTWSNSYGAGKTGEAVHHYNQVLTSRSSLRDATLSLQ